MIGPPFLKLSTTKFLSIFSFGAVGLAAGDVTAAGTTLAIAPGDITAAGDMPGAGEIPAAGLAKVGGAAGDVPGGGGGGWPREVNTRVTEQRLAISSVFIGLIGKFFPGSTLEKDFPFRLSSIR